MNHEAMGSTNWLPGVVVLLVALAVGAVLAVLARRGRQIPMAATGGVDLERQRDALYQQIRELDAGRGEMEVGDWRAERLRLELAAARTLKAMDDGVVRKPVPERPARPPTWADRHPQLVGAFWALGLAGFLGGAVYVYTENAAPVATGGGMGGGAPQQADPTTDPAFQAALADAKAKAAAKPDDFDAQNAYARMLLQAGQMMEAFQVARAVTEKDPENPTARTYQAVVLVEIGDLATAGSALDKVLSKNPDHLEALGYRGLVYFKTGQGEKAAQTWEHLLAVDPGQAGEFQPLITLARNPAAVAAQSAGAAGSSRAAAPAGPTAGAGGPHVDAPEDVLGTITVDASVGEAVRPGQTLFLFARAAGAERGPPAAARRLNTDKLPIEFRIGPGDSPMGGPFPEVMTLSARIDADGNPNTHGPEDLEARLEGVKPGATGLVLKLAHVTP